ncbi:MAG TPA: TRAM domain-containing protein [Acidimicrobiales bacterium]|nr:TRAM domain-containing protein [Acidimicrobiales bacterium]
MPPPERLHTTAMATDGRAVARTASGKVVFVDGALPGETVDVELLTDRAHYTEGRVVDVLSPSPERIRPPCPRLAEGCGGCQWQHVSADGQRRLKETMIAEALRRIGRVQDVDLAPTVHLGPWHWRTTIRAGIVDGRAALRRGQSHDLVPIRGCLIAHPLLVPLLDGRRYPGASSVVLRCGDRTGERLVATAPVGAAVDVPADVEHRYFHEEAAGRRWRVSAASFFQSRPDGADALASLVSAAAAEGRTEGSSRPRAVDAYSGVGLFAGALAEQGWSVVAVEGSRSSVSDARRNLRDLPVQVVRADLTRWRPVPADLVVADPSRAGLGTRAAAALTSTGAARIVLISCDVASLGRDAGLLSGAGYGLTSVTPVDMFPQTWHVEVVSVFDRVRSV